MNNYSLEINFKVFHITGSKMLTFEYVKTCIAFFSAIVLPSPIHPANDKRKQSNHKIDMLWAKSSCINSNLLSYQYMADAFSFLLKLAWESRYRIPLLIAIGFMAFDIRMMLEINVQMRRIRPARILPPMELDDVPVSDNYTDSDGEWIFRVG